MKITVKGTDFLICNRQKPSGKPDLFLLQVQPDNTRKYISSLYPAKGGYRFDYQGRQYNLTRQSTKWTITLV